MIGAFAKFAMSTALLDTFSEVSGTVDDNQTIGARQTKLLVEISRHGARTSS